MTFSKGHSATKLLNALQNPLLLGVWNDLGLTGTMRLVSPRASLLAFAAPGLPTPPTDSSRTAAAELLEVALAVGQADVPFHQLQSQLALQPIAAAATDMMSGPTHAGTPRLSAGVGVMDS